MIPTLAINVFFGVFVKLTDETRANNNKITYVPSSTNNKN